MVPSGLSPRCSSGDCTPIAGMATDTGASAAATAPSARSGRPSPRPRRPATARAAGRAPRRRWRPRRQGEQRRPGESGQPDPGPPRRRRRGANWLSGHDMTTRSPPMRGQRAIPPQSRRLASRRSAAVFPCRKTAPGVPTAGRPFGPRGIAVFRKRCYSSSLMSKWKTRHCPPAGPLAGAAIYGRLCERLARRHLEFRRPAGTAAVVCPFALSLAVRMAHAQMGRATPLSAGHSRRLHEGAPDRARRDPSCGRPRGRRTRRPGGRGRRLRRGGGSPCRRTAWRRPSSRRVRTSPPRTASGGGVEDALAIVRRHSAHLASGTGSSPRRPPRRPPPARRRRRGRPRPPERHGVRPPTATSTASADHRDDRPPTQRPTATASATATTVEADAPGDARTTRRRATQFPVGAPQTGGGGTAGLQDVTLFGIGGAAILAGIASLAYRRRLSPQAPRRGDNTPSAPTHAGAH